MNQKFVDAFETFTSFAKKRSPSILTACSVVGLVGTVYYAYRAGKVIPKIVEKKKEELSKCKKEDKEARKEVVFEGIKEAAPSTVPVLLLGASTTACIIGSNSISSKRIATLSAAYALSETAVKDLNRKMVEVVGEKKAREVRDSIVKEKLEENPPTADSRVIITGQGDVLCKDGFSGMYFRSNAAKIEQAILALSYQVMQEMYVSLNDFYYHLGLDNAMIGDEFGWTSDDLVQGKLPISISAQLTPEKDVCLCIDYDAMLRPDYRKLY